MGPRLRDNGTPDERWDHIKDVVFEQAKEFFPEDASKLNLARQEQTKQRVTLLTERFQLMM